MMTIWYAGSFLKALKKWKNMTFYIDQEQKYYPVITVWYSKTSVWTRGDQCSTEDLPGGTGNSSHTGTGAFQIISKAFISRRAMIMNSSYAIILIANK